jgi:predicted alpha/beta-hydrolase family hydrolase
MFPRSRSFSWISSTARGPRGLDRSGRASRFWLRRALPSALLACALAAPLAAAAQADYAREARWAEQILPSVLVGDPVWLELGSGRKFLALYTPAPNAVAGAVIVHGIGVHPDHGLIQPLRTELPERGYTTLSLQMPVLAAEARGEQYAPLFPEAAERIAAGVSFLRAKGVRRVALVSHSMGARMANYYLVHRQALEVDAWVAIGLSGEFLPPAKFPIPVLDLYGEKDLPAVREHAPRRAAALRQAPGSGQVEVAGADHFFTGRREELVRQVRLFLDARLK